VQTGDLIVTAMTELNCSMSGMTTEFTGMRLDINKTKVVINGERQKFKQKAVG